MKISTKPATKDETERNVNKSKLFDSNILDSASSISTFKFIISYSIFFIFSCSSVVAVFFNSISLHSSLRSITFPSILKPFVVFEILLKC